MTPERAYRLGVRSALDETAARALFGDVVRAATDLQRHGRKDDALKLCQSYDDGRLDTEYREVRASHGVE